MYNKQLNLDLCQECFSVIKVLSFHVQVIGLIVLGFFLGV